MIEPVTNAEKFVGCTIVNTGIIDLGVDLMFIGGALISSLGLYLAISPNTPIPPELQGIAGVGLIGTGLTSIVTSSMYRTIYPSVQNNCK